MDCITVAGITGRVDAASTDGHITLEGVIIDAIADTADGRIEITVAGPGAAVAVHADTATGDPVFVGQRGNWSSLVGRDHSRHLTISASGRVTLHDRTT